MQPKTAKWWWNHKCVGTLFSLFRLIFFFASINKQFVVGSHNLHGFKKSSQFHKKCIQDQTGVWFGQELWLPEKRLSDMTQLGVNFVARSGMEDAFSSGIYNGRPHGGVSIAWSPEMDHLIRPLVNYRHKRIVCAQMTAEPNPLLFICIYMPFFDTSKRQECLAETIETLSMLEEILSDHPNHRLVLGGDFNTEFSGNSEFDSLWRNFNKKHNLVCCDQFVNNNNNYNNNNKNYTYFHESLNHMKWNDHFIISTSLVSSSDCHEIVDIGDNPSDHLPIKMRLKICTSEDPPVITPSLKMPSLKWEKCSDDQKSLYKDRLSHLLHQTPGVIRTCSVAHCENQNCFTSIQQEYDNLERMLKAADAALPRHKPGVQKHWWTNELSRIREKSIDIHRLWQTEGKPRSGPTNDERLRVKAEYKRAIKSAQRLPKQASWDKLHNTLAQKNTTNFWKSWKHLYRSNGSSLHTVVNGISAKEEIVESFKSHFVKVSQPNSSQRVHQLKETFQKEYDEARQSHSNCSCSSHKVSLQTVLDACFSLKQGKSCDDALVSAEHIFNAPLIFFDRLQYLFQQMLLHGRVPWQFQRGTIIPLVKDRHGDQGDLNNYRGITIAPILSKAFEYALNIVFQPFLTTSNYQFGFKKKSSTSHAIYCLRETVDYYVTHGSNVYCSFLDASKAFDRLVHAGLFLKLLQRGTPLIFINLIMFWYSDLQCRVRWGETLSDWFCIKAGVRQGGILSPVFYCLYVDELVEVLSAIGIGCHIRDTFLSLLLYADDMALMAPSLKGLQTLLSATEQYCRKWDIMLNPKKTKNMLFGKKHVLPSLQLDGNNIDWVDTWSYLGVTLKAHTSFNCCIDQKVKSFYRCANGILRIEGRSSETVMLQLLESHCLPILTYAINVTKVANRDERRKLRVAYNSVYRKVFNYRVWESVTDLQHALQRPTWEELVERLSNNFQKRISDCEFLNVFH